MAPLEEVAVTVMIFGPSAKGIWALNAPFALGVEMELMAMVAFGSLTVPLTVVGLRLR